MLRTELIRPLPELLRLHAERAGDQPAFRDADRRVTWTELERRTGRLAGALAGLRLQTGDRAAICLGSRVETVESYLAIVRASAIGVPLNPRVTDAELGYLLDDSGASVIITDRAHLPQLNRLLGEHRRLTVVTADPGEPPAGVHSFEAMATTEPALPARDDLGLDDLAWMLYTSGTTGAPKGVLSTQRNCLWSVAACYVPIPGLSAEDRVVWPLPLFHSLSHIACVLGVTAVGASARLIEGLAADDVLAAMETDRATFLAGVPTMYHQLVRAARQHEFRAPHLRMALVGGALTSAELRRSFEELFKVPLLDAYGSTETCGSITIDWPTGARVAGSCGLPVPGLGVRLVDPQTGRDVPPGAEGEVWVRGPSVMAGYHNQPEETAAVMRDGWYRTGDLARRDEAGYFTITGRIKELIIRGGENIHPVEVEDVLRDVPGVADVAVAGKPHDTLGEVPVAFVVPGPEGIDPARLFAACRERLTYAKVPEELYEIKRVPRTAAGKVTRHVLVGQPALLRAVGGSHFDTLFRLEWVPLSSVSTPRPGPVRCAVAGPAAAPVAEALRAAEVLADTAADLDDLRRAVREGEPVPELAVLACAPPEAADPDPAAASGAMVEALESSIAGWMADDAVAGIPLVLLTRQAVAASPDQDVQDPAQAAAWGWASSMQVAYPGRLILVDLPDHRPSAAYVPVAVAAGAAQAAVRSGTVLLPRMTRAGVGPDPVALDARRTVLVTGAGGEQAAVVARHLVANRGIRHLILHAGPGPADRPALALKAELTRLGARVAVERCDLTDRAAVAGMLAAHKRPLGAVVHTATAVTPQARVAEAVNLDRATRGAGVGAFVLLASTAGILGLAGAASDAAADAALHAVVQRRRAAGEPAIALAYGPWDLAGATPSSSMLGTLSTVDSLAMFDAALLCGRSLLAAMRLDPDALSGGAVPAPLLGLVDVPAQRGTGADHARQSALRRVLADLPAEDRWRHLTDLVHAHAAQVLESAAPLCTDRTFQEAGLTSMLAVALRNRLTDATGLPLPATLAFDQPTPAAVVERLLTLLTTDPDAPAPAEPATAVPVAASADSWRRPQVPEASRPVDDRADAAVDSPARTPQDDPIAIVAMSGRFPGGVDTPEELWDLVVAGRDAVTAFPTDRGWDLDRLFDPDPDRPGTSHVRAGGFLADAARFDADFFDISPREALAMDPQQRLLLESAWEVLERAGIDPDVLRGSRTGVFAGAFHQGYGAGAAPAREAVGGYFATGKALSVVSGRVAYTFGLEGPVVTVDTACSSSLVALHLACQALRSGECDLAIAGGVTVMASPEGFVEFSPQCGLSADGRCRAFGADADGTGWAEGVGLLLVERLSDARRNGRQVLAIVRGSAVNSDGASNGLTAPSGSAQQRVIRDALASSGLGAADVDLIEGHGSGTQLGDPIEAHAVLATYGQGRDPQQPAWLGSLKSNIGHAQAAAGVAGVIKVVQAIRHGILPRTLHADEPSTEVDWDAGAVRLLTRQRPWPNPGRPRRGAVSSFGISGTNAHVVLEQAPETPVDPPVRVAPPVVPWLLSARSPAGLADQAARLLADTDGLDPIDVGFSLATRAAMPHRAVVAAADRATRRTLLRSLASRRPDSRVVTGTPVPGRLALLFTGQGAQRVGMGRGLYDGFPAYAEAFDETVAELDRHLDRPLAEVVFGDDQALLDRTEFTQPGLFAVEVALYRLLESWGVQPDLVAGHSIGELSAAHVSGVLSLPDACVLVTARGRLMQALPAGGAMVVIDASEAELAERLNGLTDRVSIAAINGPSSVVISGDEEAVSRLAACFGELGRRTKRIRASHAFHSPYMEPMLGAYREVAAGLEFRPAAIPLVSSCTGELAEAELLAAPEHWTEHVRQGVRFADAVRALRAERVSTFVEVGPGGVLTAMVQDCLGDEAGAVAALPALRQEREEPEAVVAAAAGMHVRGISVDWSAMFAGSGARRVDLPTYPFQGRRFWLMPGRAGDLDAAGLAPLRHPVISAAVRLPDDTGLVCTGRIGPGSHVWLRDHVVAGSALMPGAGLVDLAVRAGGEFGHAAVDQLVVETPLVLPEHGELQLRVTVGAVDALGRRSVQIYSGVAGATLWTRHASGLLAVDHPVSSAALAAVWPPPGATPVDVGNFYPRMAAAGYECGPLFQGLRVVWTRGDEVFADVELPDQAHPRGEDFDIHPALLEAALHAASFGTLDIRRDRDLLVPFAWNGVALHSAGARAMRLRVAPAGAGGISLEAVDPSGTPVITVERLLFRPIATGQLPAQGK